MTDETQNPKWFNKLSYSLRGSKTLLFNGIATGCGLLSMFTGVDIQQPVQDITTSIASGDLNGSLTAVLMGISGIILRFVTKTPAGHK